MKRIYFVRHGETDANVAKTVQPPTQELNEKGLLQAEKIAERVSGLDVSVVISSDFVRAKRTAEIIAERNNLSHEVSPLLQEVANPTSLHGINRTEPEVLAYAKAFEANLADPNWHFEDAENVYDVLKRAALAVQFLESREESDILVVTHGLFLRTVVGYLLLGSEVSSEARVRFHDRLYSSNTGLTMFSVSDDNQWQMITWNDQAHLAE